MLSPRSLSLTAIQTSLSRSGKRSPSSIPPHPYSPSCAATSTCHPDATHDPPRARQRVTAVMATTTQRPERYSLLPESTTRRQLRPTALSAGVPTTRPAETRPWSGSHGPQHPLNGGAVSHERQAGPCQTCPARGRRSTTSHCPPPKDGTNASHDEPAAQDFRKQSGRTRSTFDLAGRVLDELCCSLNEVRQILGKVGHVSNSQILSRPPT